MALTEVKNEGAPWDEVGAAGKSPYSSLGGGCFLFSLMSSIPLLQRMINDQRHRGIGVSFVPLCHVLLWVRCCALLHTMLGQRFEADAFELYHKIINK